MLHRRLYRPRSIRAWLMMIVAAMGWIAGCDVLNPALVGTVNASSVTSLSDPEGTILIAVLNNSSSLAAATVRVIKDTGYFEDPGYIDLIIPVQAADGNAANEADHAVAVQDCDVYSIQLMEIIAALPTGGTQTLGSDQPALLNGVHFTCGKVIVITITGTAPNLLVEIAVI